MAYATVAQLEEGWEKISPQEIPHYEELLERASRKIDAAVDVSKLADRYKDCVPDVCCDIVRRCKLNNRVEGSTYGSDFETDETWQSYNPTGDLFLSRENKKDLGLLKGKFGTK